MQSQPRIAKPLWLKVPFPQGERYNWIKNTARDLKLHTVCEEARCPNIGECWQGGTATFMLMGQVCTRGCRFCSVGTMINPPPLDANEPQKLASTIQSMRLTYAVITTVNRDDLRDQGALHIAQSIEAVYKDNPGIMVEILAPDFRGDTSCVSTVLASQPTVYAHNIETVDRLQARVRDPRANYRQSLATLEFSKQHRPDIATKSSIMLGLGETLAEVVHAMRDLRDVGVDFLTLGQYLQPHRRKLRVEKFVTPEAFSELGVRGRELGFRYVASGPLVRSSYKAAEFYIQQALREQSA